MLQMKMLYLLHSVLRGIQQRIAAFLKTNVSSRAGAVSYRALSEGGTDGAYGAGVLNKWTAAGRIPNLRSFRR